MQRNEWTRAHRSPHTEATEGADPTSSPRDSRRRHPNEASARDSPPGPWATSRRRPGTASSRARRPAAQSTRAAGCTSPSALWTRRGELHYRPLRETTPAHLRRPPHKLGVIMLHVADVYVVATRPRDQRALQRKRQAKPRLDARWACLRSAASTRRAESKLSRAGRSS